MMRIIEFPKRVLSTNKSSTFADTSTPFYWVLKPEIKCLSFWEKSTLVSRSYRYNDVCFIDNKELLIWFTAVWTCFFLSKYDVERLHIWWSQNAKGFFIVISSDASNYGSFECKNSVSLITKKWMNTCLSQLHLWKNDVQVYSMSNFKLGCIGFDVIRPFVRGGVWLPIDEHVRIHLLFEIWCLSSFNIRWNCVRPITSDK